MSTNDRDYDHDAQIPNELVARTLGQVGETRQPYTDDAPVMRFVNAFPDPRHVDVRRALLIDSEDPDGELRYAWTNEQRTTWKVEDAGATLTVTDADVEPAEDDEPVDDEQKYAQFWLEVAVSEYRNDVARDQTTPSIGDRIEFVGSQTLRLEGPDGRRATVEFELED